MGGVLFGVFFQIIGQNGRPGGRAVPGSSSFEETQRIKSVWTLVKTLEFQKLLISNEKQNFVKELMHKQVDEGKITSQEKATLLAQVNERYETVSKELLDANGKKKEKLTGVKQKVEARKAKLSNITPQQPPRLKHEAAIFSLRTELEPLLELEEQTSGRLLSLKEAKIMARKDEILEEIAQLEVRCSCSFL